MVIYYLARNCQTSNLEDESVHLFAGRYVGGVGDCLTPVELMSRPIHQSLSLVCFQCS